MKLSKEDYGKYVMAEFMLAKCGKPELMIRLIKEREKEAKQAARHLINMVNTFADYKRKVLYEEALDYASK